MMATHDFFPNKLVSKKASKVKIDTKNNSIMSKNTFDKRSNSVMSFNFDKPPKSLFETRTYIAPGGLGSTKTSIMYNKGSVESLGTTKTPVLKFNKQTSRPEFNRNAHLIHPMRFENINKLPSVNSKFKKPVNVEIGKIEGRKDERSPLLPIPEALEGAY